MMPTKLQLVTGLAALFLSAALSACAPSSSPGCPEGTHNDGNGVCVKNVDMGGLGDTEAGEDCTAECGARKCGPDPKCGESCGQCSTCKSKCTDEGACEVSTHSKFQCFDGQRVEWVDSCDKKEDVKKDCTQGCDIGGRYCREEPCYATCAANECGDPDGCACNECPAPGKDACMDTCGSDFKCAATPETSTQCQGLDVYFLDSCGEQGGLKETCRLIQDESVICQNGDLYYREYSVSCDNGACQNPMHETLSQHCSDGCTSTRNLCCENVCNWNECGPKDGCNCTCYYSDEICDGGACKSCWQVCSDWGSSACGNLNGCNCDCDSGYTCINNLCVKNPPPQ